MRFFKTASSVGLSLTPRVSVACIWGKDAYMDWTTFDFRVYSFRVGALLFGCAIDYSYPEYE